MWLAQQIPQSVDWFQTGIIGSLTLLVIWTGLKRKWLFAWQHDEIVKDRDVQLRQKTIECDEWKRLALRQAGIIEQTVDRTASLVTRAVVENDPRVKRLDLGLGDDDA